MNTAELKKLAEAATPGPWIHATDIGQVGSIETLQGIVVAQAQSLICDDVRKQRDNNSKYIAAANPAAILELLAINAELVEALRWYAEQTRLCRLIHSGGDSGRNALAGDGGSKARAALARYEGEKE